jgi:hypothetical protein
MLIDYNAVAHHDSTVMDNWTIDGDYIHRNFGSSDKVYVVQDSDEIMQISWAPLSDKEQSLEPTSPRYLNWFYGDWIKRTVFYGALSNPIFDPLKRKIFPLPVFWHARDINTKKWRRVEKKAITVIAKCGGSQSVDVAGLLHAGTGIGARWIYESQSRIAKASIFFHQSLARLAISIFTYLFQVGRFVLYYWRNREHLFFLMKQALQGNADARMRIKRSARSFLRLAVGSEKNMFT